MGNPLFDKTFAKTEAILIEHRDMPHYGAAQLLEEETLSGDQLAAIVGSPARQPSTSTAD